MTTELLVEADLKELLSGITPPDLVDSTLARIDSPAPMSRKASRPNPATLPGQMILLRMAAAACVLFALGLIVWLLWPRPQSEPGPSELADVGGVARTLAETEFIEIKAWNASQAGEDDDQLYCWGDVTDPREVGSLVEALVGSFRVAVGDDLDDEIDAWEDARAQVCFVMPSGRRLVLFDLGGGRVWVVRYSDGEDEQYYWNDGTFAQALLPHLARVQNGQAPSPHFGFDAIRQLGRGRVAFEGTNTVLDGGAAGAFLQQFIPREGQPSLEAQATDWDYEIIAFLPDYSQPRLAESVPAGTARPFATFTLKDNRTATLASPDFAAGTVLLRYNGWSHYYRYRLAEGARAELEKHIGAQRVRQLINEEQEDDPQADPQGFRVLREWTGADSKRKAAHVELVTDLKAWERLWHDHKRPADNERAGPAPTIDFDNEFVLALFAGPGFNSSGYLVQEILLHGATFTVRVDEKTYQTSGGAVESNSYGLFVLPATDYAVIVEENVQGLLNKPALWTEIARRDMQGLPDPDSNWNPKFSLTGEGGPDRRHVHIIHNVEQWAKVLADLPNRNGAWPSPDFSKECAIVASAPRPVGDTTLLELRALGISAERAVLRLTMPIIPAWPTPMAMTIYGVCVLPRLDLEIVVETQAPAVEGESPRWSEFSKSTLADRGFGIYYIESGLDGGSKDASFGLAHNQEEFATLTKTMDIKVKRAADWINWDKENVIVILPGEMRVDGGLTTTTTTDKGVHTITYHLSGPSGRDPGLHRPRMLLKVPKTNDAIILMQSEVSGPAPAEVTEVARFEK